MTSDFRSRARRWLAENARSFPDGDPYEVAQAVQGRLHRAGFAGISWPHEYGGQGLTDAERRVWDEEAQPYGIPTQPLSVGLGMVAPILLDLGTEAQKRRFVPRLVSGEWVGCQMFSEPEAGSDLASLRTRAVLDGDEWVVNGQKVWTSHAHRAHVGILIARTAVDVPRHQGITMFVLDMRTPGVTVRPLRDMTGAFHFNEVFLDDVRLPADSVVGAVDEGWAAIIRLLRHERAFIANQLVPEDSPTSAQWLAALIRGTSRAADPIVRRTLAEIFVGQRVKELFAARMAEEIKAGGEIGARGSIGKLADGRQSRRLATVMTTLLGSRVSAWAPGDAAGEAVARVVTGAPRMRIGGGTDEIQRNIIGERLLGLPKERMWS